MKGHVGETSFHDAARRKQTRCTSWIKYWFKVSCFALFSDIDEIMGPTANQESFETLSEKHDRIWNRNKPI